VSNADYKYTLKTTALQTETWQDLMREDDVLTEEREKKNKKKERAKNKAKELTKSKVKAVSKVKSKGTDKNKGKRKKK
jgi:hypothetical protein